ncbi:MAG: DUF5947 family protein [Bryobacteraceae bacterium]
MSATSSSPKNVFDALRGFSRRHPAEERCDLCGAALPAEHRHLFQQSDRRVICGCDPCAILFSHRDGATKFLHIPRSGRKLENFQITDAEWNALRLPIDLAFFGHNSSEGRIVAYYPSPAGSTESLLSLEAWDDIVRQNPLLATMEPDVEALLVNRTQDRRDYFIAPIDQCYRLTGVIRMHWRGFSGGERVWQEVERAFGELERRSITAGGAGHA